MPISGSPEKDWGFKALSFIAKKKKKKGFKLSHEETKTLVGFHCGHASTTHKVRWNVADVDSLVWLGCSPAEPVGSTEPVHD